MTASEMANIDKIILRHKPPKNEEDVERKGVLHELQQGMKNKSLPPVDEDGEDPASR